MSSVPMRILAWIGISLAYSIALASNIRGAAPSFDASLLTCTPWHRPNAPRIAIALPRINDEFCDCADGADEPGTSACANGRFWCANVAHSGRFIPSAWVDDGNCDCCDGSDEPLGKCADTCASDRQAALKSASAAAAQIMAGVRKRRQYSRSAASAAKDEAKQLSEARAELAEVSKILERCEHHADGLRARRGAEGTPDTSDEGYTSDVHNDDFTRGESGSEDEWVSTDEDKKVESVESENKNDADTKCDAKQGVPMDSDEMPSADCHIARPVENASTNTQMDLEPFCEELSLGSGNVFMRNLRLALSKSLAKVKWISPKIFAKIGITSSKGLDKCIELAEEKTSKLSSRKQTLESKINDLEKNAGHDYGPDSAMRELRGKCIKKKVSQYEFEHCPYDKVRQYEHGRLVAQLGTFYKVEGHEMVYKDGAPCWNGPDRSVRVQLQCGEKNDVISVDEPSRCTYIMVFSTPVVCEEAEANRLLSEAGIDDVSKEVCTGVDQVNS